MSWGQAAIGLGGSLLGGLFGQRPKQSQAEIDQQQIAAQERQLAGILQGYGTQAHSQYQNADADAQRQLGLYADLLRQNPNTDQARTQDIGNATAGSNRAYEASKSGLSAELARRGIDDSSATTGGLTGLAAAHNTDISNAYNDRLQREQADRYARAGQLTSLLQGNASNYNNIAGNDLGMATNTNGSAFGMYGGLASAEDARNAAYANSQAQNASTFGQIAGSIAPALSKGPPVAMTASNGLPYTPGYTGDPDDQQYTSRAAGIPGVTTAARPRKSVIGYG